MNIDMKIKSSSNLRPNQLKAINTTIDNNISPAIENIITVGIGSIYLL